MRILTYLTMLEAAGGVALNVVQVATEMTRRGHQVDLVYSHDGNLGDAFRAICSSVELVPSPRYFGARIADTRRILRAAFIASRTRPDIVYVQNFSELAWAVLVRKLTGARIVCHLHDSTPSGSVYRRLIGGQVSRFVAVSNWMRTEWIGNGIAGDRIEVVPNGIRTVDYPRASDADRARCRAELGLPADAYVVLYAGRVVPAKGVDVLVDAWHRLGLDPQRARLLVLGGRRDLVQSDYERQLRSRAVPGIEWHLMRPEVVGAMHAADVIVLPSLIDESFGRVLVEAMSTGIPAVASAVGAIPEVLDGEFAQMLFRPGDAESLADRLSGLADWRRTDPGLAERCARHAARYALDDTVTQLETVFENALGRR